MPRPTVILALALGPWSAALAACPGPEISVCASGCDESNLKTAIEGATGGQTVCIDDDRTYDHDPIVVSAKSITVRVDPGNTPVLQSNNKASHFLVDNGAILTISDLIIDGSSGTDQGIIIQGGASVIATRLTIRDHASAFNGTGVDISGGGNLTASECVFDNNDSENNGGAIWIDSGTLSLDRSVLSNNSGDEGGGLYFRNPSNQLITRNVFCSNAATNGDGGGLYVRAASGTDIQGNIFLENSASDQGGGVYVHDQSGMKIANNTFAGNSRGNDGAGLHNRQGAGDVVNNVFQDHPSTAAFDDSANSDFSYSYNAYHSNNGNTGGDASTGATDLITDLGLPDRPYACNAALVRHPSDSAVIGAGDNAGAYGNDPGGSSNSIGAFGGTYAFDVDLDGDGYGADVDCDETNTGINPGAAEIPSNGIDEDCSGADFFDNDGDGFEAPADCNDNNINIYPGAAEIVGDGIDQDCDDADDCYVDLDNDGSGDGVGTATGLDCDAEAGFASLGGDCDDLDNERSTAFTEIIGDGIDNDCNLAEICYVDGDGDGVPTDASTSIDNTAPYTCTGAGQALEPAEFDCQDNLAARYPGATEIPASGVDEDCDNEELCYSDGDGDSYGAPGATTPSTDLTCSTGGLANDNLDCDDSRSSVNPGAAEITGNERDDDCNGQEICFWDSDDDGYGGTLTIVSTADTLCDATFEATDSTDCEDSDASINPMATDITGNTVDENCDGRLRCWRDQDGDGAVGTTYAGLAPALSCSVAGFALTVDADDCDDDDATRYPGATEIVANGIDESCDDRELCYEDGDDDGVTGSDTVTSNLNDLTCTSGANYAATDQGDCNDNLSTVFPGAIEQPADSTDQNCDGLELCYVDVDGDGFAGNTQGLISTLSCVAPGHGPANVDCNDTLATGAAIFPGATETVDNNLDQNCDGLELCYVDNDGDTYGSTATTTSPVLTCIASGVATNNTDCADNNSAIRPNATEIARDGIDQNCDNRELCASDSDGDGFGNQAGNTTLGPVGDLDCTDNGVGISENTDDCNDGNVNVNPSRPEGVADGVDSNCDGLETCYSDADNDGYGVPALNTNGVVGCTGTNQSSRNDDCDDTEATSNPDADEVPNDGIDQDCNGSDLVGCYQDSDLDGFGSTTVVLNPAGDCNDPGFSDNDNDCNDTTATVFPPVVENGVITVAGAPDSCDGIDNDCSDTIVGFDGMTLMDDHDGDGIGVDDEAVLGTSDCEVDSDFDGIRDDDEINGNFATDPAEPDTDGDGVDDLAEWPSVADGQPDFDSDGIPDVVDFDDDGDGVNSVVEGDRSVDTDGDGIPDREDEDDDGDTVSTLIEAARTAGVIPGDTDNDGIKDYLDPDDDGDGWLTIDEIALGSGHYDVDSDLDTRFDILEGRWIGTIPVLGTEVDCAQPTSVSDGIRSDFDADGNPDILDTDDDGDGHPTFIEGNGDLDGDGCANAIDLDLDGDGKLDIDESPFNDADLDGISDLFDSDDADGGIIDADGDGVTSIKENQGTLSLDPDTSCAERARVTEPYLTTEQVLDGICDSDNRGDGAIDGLELGPAPDFLAVDRDLDGIVDWKDDDDDGDGISTREETGLACPLAPDAPLNLIALTVSGDINVYLDCGEGDFYRLVLRTPGDREVTYRDTDGDGIYDFQDPDDDGDGWPTLDEALDPDADRDGDGIPDYLDGDDESGPLGDRDADGIPNEVEEALGLSPYTTDSDGDGFSDSDELGDPNDPRDTDGDGIIDALDTDDDDDGIPTADEGDADTDGDGVPNYLDRDSDGDGVEDGDEYDLDDDCDGVPDHIDGVENEGLCDTAAFTPSRYKRQDGCNCTTASPTGALAWLGLLPLLALRRRR